MLKCSKYRRSCLRAVNAPAFQYGQGINALHHDAPGLTIKTPMRRETRKTVNDKSKTVRGIVIAADWDEAGNVVAIAVSAPGEKQYIVKQDSIGKELKRFMRQEVEVIGVVGKGRKGWNNITVKAYELIKTYE